MHFHQVKAVLIVGPNSSSQLFASEDLSGGTHEDREQSEFVGGEGHGLLPDLRSARGEVKAHISCVEDAVHLRGRIVCGGDVSNHGIRHDTRGRSA